MSLTNNVDIEKVQLQTEDKVNHNITTSNIQNFKHKVESLWCFSNWSDFYKAVCLINSQSIETKTDLYKSIEMNDRFHDVLLDDPQTHPALILSYKIKSDDQNRQTFYIWYFFQGTYRCVKVKDVNNREFFQAYLEKTFRRYETYFTKLNWIYEEILASKQVFPCCLDVIHQHCLFHWRYVSCMKQLCFTGFAFDVHLKSIFEHTKPYFINIYPLSSDQVEVHIIALKSDDFDGPCNSKRLNYIPKNLNFNPPYTDFISFKIEINSYEHWCQIIPYLKQAQDTLTKHFDYLSGFYNL